MKILFIGDLRTANNYGAIATTETLNKMLVNALPDAEFKYIDFRSFRNPTPINGWPIEESIVNEVYIKFKSFVKRFLPFFIQRIVKDVFLSRKSMNYKSFVPYKLSVFNNYYLRLKEGEIFGFEKRLLEWADIVYINGEGNLVHGVDKEGKYRTGGLYILFMAWLAKEKFKKDTFIVNHVVDPANKDIYEIISELYPKLDKVFVRDTLSLSKLKDIGVNNASFVPDALFGYKPLQNWHPSTKILQQIDFSKPYICIGDSSGIKNTYNKVKWDVVKVLSELIEKLKGIIPQVIFVDGYNGFNTDINQVVKKNNIGVVNLKNCSYHDLFHVLRKAEIFISGRWHASILSVLANTPVLLWGADSHKTKSLYTLLDYPFSFYEITTLPIHIDDMIIEVEKILKEKDRVKKLLKEKVTTLSERAIENVSFLQEYKK